MHVPDNMAHSHAGILLILNIQWIIVSSFLVGRPPFEAYKSRPLSKHYNKQQYTDLDSMSLGFRRPSIFQFRKTLLPRLSAVTEDEFVKAEDLEAIQSLFSKYCDSEGLLTKELALKVPAIAELIADDDLLPEEFDDIWDRAPKFPEADVNNTLERIDVDSWVQLYRDIDDLFEDDKENDNPSLPVPTPKSKAIISQNVVSIINDSSGEEESVDSLRTELRSMFASISGESGTVSRDDLYQWDEIQSLLSDGLLGKDELDELWDKTEKNPNNQLDLKGFLSFNTALDSLFEFDDEEVEKSRIPTTSDPVSLPRMVQGDGLEPELLFEALANKDNLVGQRELKLWVELQEMIAVGDLLQTELDGILSSVKKSEKDLNKLDKDGFISLYQAINDLFESDEEESNDDQQIVSQKQELLEAIEDLEEDGKLPCGLDADDREKSIIRSIVDELENESGNMMRQKKGAIDPSDLVGDWKLLYSSSSAMRFNKGLSGLGGSFPNGQFDSLIQKLKASKFVMDIEYIEHIKVKPEAASFDVVVTGYWDLKTSVSLFTGEPSIVMTVTPDRVNYGPTSTRADHWKSLGPMNMLDISYLDEDLRIMRGNTSVETIFIFRRCL